jgi:hypothetical protein
MTISVTLFTKELHRPSWQVAQHLASLGVEFEERRFDKSQSAIEHLALLLEMRSCVLASDFSTSLLPVVVIERDAAYGGNITEVDRLLSKYRPFLSLVDSELVHEDGRVADFVLPARRMPSQPNYLALSEAMKIYIDTMREFIRAKMSSCYPADWDTRVQAEISGEAQENLEVHKANHTFRDIMDYADPSSYSWIVEKNQAAFKEVLETRGAKNWRSRMNAVVEARNAWAHPHTGDVLTNELAHYLGMIIDALDCVQQFDASKCVRELQG